MQSLEVLGIPTRRHSVEQNSRTIWQRFASHYHLFLGTPTDLAGSRIGGMFGIATPWAIRLPCASMTN